MLQHEPREARTLADAAVGDDRTVALDALIGVELFQLVLALERPIVVAVLAPGNALRAGDMPAALTGFRQAGRREDLARELRVAANVDQGGLLLRLGLLY